MALVLADQMGKQTMVAKRNNWADIGVLAHPGPQQNLPAPHGLHPHGLQVRAAGEAFGGGHVEAGWHRPGAREKDHHFLCDRGYSGDQGGEDPARV